MYAFTLPFRGQELEIQIASALSEPKLFDVETAVTELVNSLSHLLGIDSLKSPIQHLNDSDVNSPVEIPDDILHYIEMNVQVAQRSEAKINPFSLNEMPIAVNDIGEYYEVNEGDDTISRRQSIHFNSLVIIAPYILSQIEEVLTSLGAVSFLISYHNMQVARGSERWEVKFSQPDSEDDLEIVIQDEAIYMHLIPVAETTTDRHNPFQATDQTPGHAAVIVESINLLQARVIAAFAAELHYDYQFAALAAKWTCGLTVLTNDGEIKQFAG